MTENGQTFAALGVVAAAALYLVWSAWGKREKPGCGSNCGCPTGEIKAKLAAADGSKKPAK